MPKRIRDTDDMQGHPGAAPMIVMLRGGVMPSKFRLFRKGWNRTSKGNFLFDDLSAAAVMSAYARRGNDVAIDLEHLSLDPNSQSFDPDARGWCQLAVPDGELWAINVRWTPDGQQRLANATQRYVSPVFTIADNKRITSIFNIAICAVPATYETPALVAASQRSGTTIRATALEVREMDPVKQIAAWLGLPDGATLEDIKAAIDALAAAAKAASTAADDAPPADAEATGDDSGVDPETLKALDPKVQAQILALSATAVQNTKRLAALEKSTATDKVDALIKANADKLTPKTEKWARGMSVETLTAFFANAPKLTAEAHSEQKRPPAESSASAETVTLTDGDKALIKITKADPKVILAQRQKEADARRAKEMS